MGWMVRTWRSLRAGDEGPGREEVVLGEREQAPSKSLRPVPVSGTATPGARGEERVQTTRGCIPDAPGETGIHLEWKQRSPLCSRGS